MSYTVAEQLARVRERGWAGEKFRDGGRGKTIKGQEKWIQGERARYLGGKRERLVEILCKR